MSGGEDWTAAERARLEALAKEAVSPDALERRVVAALRERGEIAAPRGAAGRRGWRGALAAAAAVILFAGGMWAGRLTSPGPPAPGDESPRFALFLYPGDQAVPTPPEADLVAEYGEWARSLSMQGHLASGEKLKPGGRDLAGDSGSTDTLEGFFILSAASMEEAEALARTCPHLRYGGRIALREIDRT